MRLLKLKIKNIHSLKGEHVVDFSQGPLAESGLFAITGPTGAGKSTLLDAITLALFNKIPRFAPKGTENLSKTEIDKAGSVITHHTDEAWAEVEYEAGSVAYRSTWKISRARTGNLKDYDMTLANLSDKHNMDLKKSEVPAENERILGLKYEQFIRSIVLAQGDFARLLKSDEKERAKLLEDITGSHIYREIGRAIFEKSKEADQHIAVLKQEMAVIPILSEEESQEKEEVRKYSAMRAAESEARIQGMNDTLVKLQRKKALNQSMQELTEQWNAVQGQKKASEGKFAALQLHTTLLPLRPTVAVWKQATIQRDINNEAIQNTTVEKIETNTQLEQSLSALSAFTGFKVDIDNYVEEAMRFSKEILDMDRRIAGLKEEGIRIKNMMEERTKDLNIASVVEINHEKDRTIKLRMVHTRLEVLKGNLARSQGPSENIREDIKRLQLQLESLFEKANLVGRLEKIHEEEKQNRDQIALTAQLIVRKKTEQKYVEKEHTDLQRELGELSKEKEQIFKQSNLDELRMTLADGDPCPLCGSIHHPYGHKDFTSSVGSLEIKIQSVQRKLEQVNYALQQVNTNLVVLGGDLERCTVKLVQLSKESEELKGRVPENLSSEALQRTINTLKDQIQTREIEQAERAELAELTIMKDYLEKMQELTEQIKEEQKQLQNRYSGVDIQSDINLKINTVKNLQEKKNSLQAKIDTLTKEFEKSHNWSVEMLEKLRVGFLQAGIDTIEGGLAGILDDTIADEWMQEKNMLDTKEVELQTRLEDTRQQLTLLENVQAEQGLEWLENEIKALITERDRLNHEIGAIGNELKHNLENIALRAEKERQIIQKIQKNEALYNLNALIGDAQGVKYAKFAQNISLRTLIRHANMRLTDITDRYRLVFTDMDTDLTVEDLYQGNTRRSVKTLSGGETFMVSLAMALSLSDMASSHVQMDSIFIDEGFGTLDMETLESAIITLEKLQAKSQKTIGIISHVPLLKERIHTQVMLKKNNLGYSEIEIKG